MVMEAEFESLLDVAKDIARRRHARVPSIVKEIMHYEILQALIESGAANSLVFQGGTALRLCYGGNRYSEDLDFVGGKAFDPSIMGKFMKRLQYSVGEAYGLAVEIDQRLPIPENTIPVGRWKAKIKLPQEDKSLKQSHVIHLEVAAVPAHTSQLHLVRPLSRNVEYSYQSLMLPTESREEILADKIVALADRPYLKQRDLWDIHMLVQSDVVLNADLVAAKLSDYQVPESDFMQKLDERLAQMDEPETRRAFVDEMGRFLDDTTQPLLGNKDFLAQVFNTVIVVAQQSLSDIERKAAVKANDPLFKVK